MIFTIGQLEAWAKHRPEGYMEDVLAAGQRNGDQVELSDDAFAALLQKYRPSARSRAASLLQAAGRWLADGLQLSDSELEWERSAVCSLCHGWDAKAGQCLLCTCTKLKLKLRSEKCPVGKW